ncbi:MAG: hypothetical protein QXT35_05490 [Conexivisphaerales archaeon]
MRTTVWKILRKKKHVRYGKPYSKRPEEGIFKKKFDGALSKVRQEYSVEPIIGFLDENSLHSDPCRSHKYACCTVKARAAGGQGPFSGSWP